MLRSDGAPELSKFHRHGVRVLSHEAMHSREFASTSRAAAEETLAFGHKIFAAVRPYELGVKMSSQLQAVHQPVGLEG